MKVQPAWTQGRGATIALVVLALAHMWVQFQAAFAPGFVLANSGDGLRTIGVIAHFRAAFESESWLRIFLTEQFHTLEDFGFPRLVISLGSLSLSIVMIVDRMWVDHFEFTNLAFVVVINTFLIGIV